MSVLLTVPFPGGLVNTKAAPAETARRLGGRFPQTAIVRNRCAHPHRQQGSAPGGRPRHGRRKEDPRGYFPEPVSRLRHHSRSSTALPNTLP